MRPFHPPQTLEDGCSSLLKNAVVTFFNLAKLGAKLLTARKQRLEPLFWHRIRAMSQPSTFSTGC